MMKINKRFLTALIVALFAAAAMVSFAQAASTPEQPLTQFDKADAFYGISDITEITGDVQLPSYAYVSGSGVKIIGNTNNSEFAYKYPINLNNFTGEDSLISMYVLSGEEYGIMSGLTITLTDIADEDNQISYEVTRASSQNFQNSYVLIGNEGRLLARSNESAQAGRVFNGIYGTVLWSSSFNGAAHNFVRPISVGFDVRQKQAFVRTKDAMFMSLDLGDPNDVGAGNVWGGFTTGEVILSVSFRYEMLKPGGVIVTDIMGNSLAGKVESPADYSKPTINVNVEHESYLTDMPVAAVSVPYAVPGITAVDWLTGPCPAENMSVKILRGGSDVTSNLQDGKFTPTEKGIYTIEYTAKNLFDAETIQTLSFEVIERLPDTMLTFASSPAAPRILGYYYIPEIVAAGGSGQLRFTETAQYNGKQIDLSASRSVFIDAPGLITITAEAHGYTGAPARRIFAIKVPDTVVLYVPGMPAFFEQGKSVTLPSYTAYDTLNPSVPVETDVTVNGTSVAEDGLTFTVPDTPELQIVYSAQSNGLTVTKEYNVPVVKINSIKDYLLSDSQNVTLKDSTYGVQVITSTDNSEVALPYAIPIDGLAVRFSTDETRLAFGYVDVILEDYNDANNSIFLRFSPSDSTSSYIQVNGLGSRFLMEGSLISEDSVMAFFINRGHITDRTGVMLADISTFSVSTARVKFRLGNVAGPASIYISQVGNQTFNIASNGLWNGDRTPPALVLESFLDNVTTAELNTMMRIPAAKAFDVLSYQSEIDVKVTAPDGSIVYAGDATKEVLIKAEMVGFYTITYAMTDGSATANRAQSRFNYKIVDNSPIELSIGTVPSTIVAGTSIVIPSASATKGEEVVIEIILVEDAYFRRTVLKANQAYVFSKPGKYTLCYFAYNEDFSYTVVSFDIEVVSTNFAEE